MPNTTASAETFPASLRERTTWLRLAGVPALLALPEAPARSNRGDLPAVLWMHGRTVSKELDPGRYLRWIRAGIVACAVDLPGHGERFDPRLQAAEATLEVVERMALELDDIVAALGDELRRRGLLDAGERIAGPASGLVSGLASGLALGIGGMSAGGMATMIRLCSAHGFTAASVEASTGSWGWQSHRAMWDAQRAAALNPIAHLEGWRDIPFQAIHARHDEWVNVEGQQEFIDALRARSQRPEQIEFLVFEERTGAPFEHAGFGRFGGQAKDAQTQFWQRRLLA